MKIIIKFFFILFLTFILIFIAFQYKTQKELDFEINNFVDNKTTEILKIKNNNWSQILSDSSINWSTCWKKKNASLIFFDSIYQSKKYKLLDEYLIFENNKLEFIYLSFDGDIIRFIENNHLKPTKENNLWYDKYYFFRKYKNKLVLSKQKNKLLNKKRFNFKFRNNPNANLQLLDIKNNTEEDVYIEKGEVFVSKYLRNKKNIRVFYEYPIIKMIPSNFQRFVYCKINNKTNSTNFLHKKQWIGNDVCEIEMNNEKIILLNYKGYYHVDDILEELNNKKNDTTLEKFSIRDHNYFEIDNDSLKKIKWVGSVEDILVLGSSKKAIEEYEISLHTGKTFNTKLFEKIPRNSNYVEYDYGLKQSKVSLSKENVLNCFAQSNNHSYTNFKYLNTKQNNQETYEWKCEFTHKILKGKLISDHIDGSSGLVVFNDQFQLIYLNHNGEKKWTYQLEDSIIGDIKSIDLFGNNKNQILASTIKKLHIIDLKGNRVRGFPVKYDQPASTSVFDIDFQKNNNYFFITGHSDGFVSKVNEKGEKNSKWKFKQKKTAIDGDINGFVINNKGYIQFYDKNNNQFFIDEYGKKVEVTTSQINRPRINVIKNKFRKSYTSELKEGYLKVNFWNGITDELNLPISKYNFIQTINDKYFVLKKHNQIHFLNHIGLMEFEVPLVSSMIHKMILLVEDENIKYVAYSDESYLYLTNQSGVLIEGFPKRTSDLFWVKLSKELLVYTYFNNSITKIKF